MCQVASDLLVTFKLLLLLKSERFFQSRIIKVVIFVKVDIKFSYHIE